MHLVIALFFIDPCKWMETKNQERRTKNGFLSAESAERLRFLWWFGLCIGNTDMHYGNMSLHLASEWPCALAPVYDMSPMALHPRSDGSLPDHLPTVPPPPPEEADMFKKASGLAADYRHKLMTDSRLSKSFKAAIGSPASRPAFG